MKSIDTYTTAGEKEITIPLRFTGGELKGGARFILLLMSVLFLTTAALSADNPENQQ